MVNGGNAKENNNDNSGEETILYIREAIDHLTEASNVLSERIQGAGQGLELESIVGKELAAQGDQLEQFSVMNDVTDIGETVSDIGERFAGMAEESEELTELVQEEVADMEGMLVEPLEELLEIVEADVTERLEARLEELVDTVSEEHREFLVNQFEEVGAEIEAHLERLEAHALAMGSALEEAVTEAVQHAQEHAENVATERVQVVIDEVVDDAVRMLMDEIGLNAILLQLGAQTTAILSPHIVELRIAKELLPLIEQARLEL